MPGRLRRFVTGKEEDPKQELRRLLEAYIGKEVGQGSLSYPEHRRIRKTPEGVIDCSRGLYIAHPELRSEFDRIVMEYLEQLFSCDCAVTMRGMIDLLGEYAPWKQRIDGMLRGYCIRMAAEWQETKKGRFTERQIHDAHGLDVPQDVIDVMVQGNLQNRLGRSWAHLGIECAKEYGSKEVLEQAIRDYGS